MSTLDHTPNLPLTMERLEGRDTPAGNVSVFLSGGQLFAYGDDADNQFTVQQNSSGDIFVDGLYGTTVNGQASVYVGNGFLDGLQMVGGNGSDRLGVAGVYTPGTLALSGGDGDDGLILNGVTAGSLTVDAGTGNDVVVTANGVQVFGFADVSGGAGVDTLQYGGLSAGGGAVIREFEVA